MNVAAILSSKGRAVTTARSDTALIDVSSKLAAKKIGCIVIMGEQGRIDGIMSERDVIRAIAEAGAAALQQSVGQFMTSNVQTCHEGTTLEELMETMTQGRFRHLPVVDDSGALVGIISIGDVVKHHVAEVEMEVSAMRGYLATG
ncbi:MAG: CBS domain-containing protein [Hyphomicrobium sp.]